MLQLEAQRAEGHEEILLAQDPDAGYRAFFVIHSTALGPAVGGTRVWPYPDDETALADARRLARGMTYKNAVAGLPFGGGKVVVVADGRGLRGAARDALFRAHGRAVEQLGGRFITGEDVGTSVEDMEIVRAETRHVSGVTAHAGDPSPFTARGVFRAIEASIAQRLGPRAWSGVTVAIQGCGHVGAHLARELSHAGARLVVADVDEARAARLAREFGAVVAPPPAIYEADATVFAPCALGGCLNDDTIPRLAAPIVAGGANNQLEAARHGAALAARGLLYAPDYVANAGGVISGAIGILGWSREEVARRVEGIHDTLLAVFAEAARTGATPAEAADRLAERRIHRK